LENLNDINKLGDRGVDGRIALKLFLKAEFEVLDWN
jgi:hypothetical protein